MIDHPQDIVFLVLLSLKERIDCDKKFSVLDRNFWPSQ